MNKLLVRDPKTGETRPMTKSSFDLAGKKRGFTIVGKVEVKEEKSSVQLEMERLRAEKVAKDAAKSESIETETAQESVAVPKKRGPKSKKNQDEV